jgi:dipeptidase E
LGNNPDQLLRLLGSRRRTAVIANATDPKDADGRAACVQREVDSLFSLGIEPVELDLRAYFGKPEELRSALSDLDMLWVRGGNSFVLRRAFRQSGADVLIPELLRNDALVYAGYSAGPCILGPSLRGVEQVDHADTLAEGYDPEVVWEGLGILPYAIAPHYRSPHPETEAVERLVEFYIGSHVPFVALRDGQAIVRDSDGERVVG